MVITFTLTLLSHYNSITKPRARFLLSLIKDLTIDFPSHFITYFIDVYQDTATRDKLIFPLAIMLALQQFSSPILLSPFITVMGAISAGSFQWSEAQLQSKWPPVETINRATPTAPPSSAPFLWPLLHVRLVV